VTAARADSGEDAARLETASLEDVLRYALSTFGADLRIACSFGVEDMVVLHESVRIGADVGIAPRVFLLDTGRLHQETYDLLDRARDRYGIEIEAYAADTLRVEDLVRRKGPNSFYRSIEDRRECCHVRKVEPLGRALAGAKAWVTGLRREQSQTREELRVVEVDVWAFARANRVPTHALHARGYPSIGCAPCTRAVAEGESARAGRWWWESPEHKECGLHPRRAS
jgi:phosphoadenosine phosphosulfate reductase